jgi:hypothetical protein
MSGVSYQQMRGRETPVRLQATPMPATSTKPGLDGSSTASINKNAAAREDQK